MSDADERLVADELARLDALADRPEADDIALHAFIRAWCLRRLPEATAAAILRQEAIEAFSGNRPTPVALREPAW